MVVLENDILRVHINERGAELTSIYNKVTRLEYLWKGDPAYWGKHSPVLFPIVGALKENTYYHNFKAYVLPRHGFAREKMFEAESVTGNQAVFSLSSDQETLAIYPFSFRLYLSYTIQGNELSASYRVVNTGDEKMYFSLGAHPAFAVPVVDGDSYSDHYLEFDQPEHTNRWSINPEGLLSGNSELFLNNESRIRLKKELFYKDALVFKDLHSTKISLRSDKHAHGLEMIFAGFPYLGIWAAKNADFVCIEPWCGIADNEHGTQKLKDKEGIEAVDTGEEFRRTWSIALF